jgi:hypothetical protein
MRPGIARYDGQVLRSVREFVPPGAILPWDLALLAEKQR